MSGRVSGLRPHNSFGALESHDRPLPLLTADVGTRTSAGLGFGIVPMFGLSGMKSP